MRLPNPRLYKKGDTIIFNNNEYLLKEIEFDLYNSKKPLTIKAWVNKVKELNKKHISSSKERIDVMREIEKEGS